MALVSLVCYLGCKDPGGDPVTITPPPVEETPLTKDDSVLANAYIVAEAAEAFAAANGGVFAPWSGYELSDGRTLIDFLPDGQLLANPYTGLRTEPQPAWGVDEGQIGYSYYRPDPPFGYLINAVGGVPNENLLVLVNDPEAP